MRYQQVAPLCTLVVSLSLSLQARADAATIYQWVDESGITHYSSTPPTVPQGKVRTIRLPAELPRVRDPRDDYFSVVNQARRMEEASRALEQARFERHMQRQRVALERAVVEADRAAVEARESGRVGVVWSPWYYPSPHRWSPGRAARPPCRTEHCRGRPPGYSSGPPPRGFHPHPPAVRPPVRARPSPGHQSLPVTASRPARR